MMAIYLLLEILGPSKLFAASHVLSRGCLPYYIRSTLQLLEKRTKKKLLPLQLLLIKFQVSACNNLELFHRFLRVSSF
ncbi:uncharacterized protein DS421_13g415070 [Arachis hypogaea]|nr:uncharacterized protein DS421_13g415070 [Arachis hypogaea]